MTGPRVSCIAHSVALACSGTALAQAPEHFDLVCSGTMREISGAERSFAERFAIDLSAGAYCFQGCRAPSTIARIEPGWLVLKDDPPNHAFQRNVLRISRTEGAYTRLVVSRSLGTADQWNGTCAVADFTPLPARAF